VVFNAALAAVDHLSPDKSEDAAIIRVHRDDRVHQHADVATVAHRAEADFATGMCGEVEFRCVSNGQHVPTSCAPGGQPRGMRQHFVPGDRLVVEEVVEPARAAAVAGQQLKAHRPLRLHRCQQSVAGGSQTPVAELAKLGLIHGNPSLPLRCD
jgi:hypothetical protein